MRKSGRIISLIMSALIVFSAGSTLTSTAFAAEKTSAVTGAKSETSGTIEKCKWKFDSSTGVLTITGNGSMTPWGVYDECDVKVVQLIAEMLPYPFGVILM
ncbi:MAG: hypothetical protein IIU14_05905 [Ruminococcus sp.]|nr:hypothetical protein [Ruminococcus sp.]